MASSGYKMYNIHGFNPRTHLDDYMSDKPDMPFKEDFLRYPIAYLTKAFKDGRIKGDVLMDLSIGSMVHHLIASCECFKNTILLRVQDRCILELKRWMNTRTGAFNWSHAIEMHEETEGKSGECQDKEAKMKSLMPHVLRCNFANENITEPIVLPKADCMITVWLLDIISKDQDDYKTNLRKIIRLMKPGGKLILIGCFGTTHFKVGNDKLHALTYDEAFIKNALNEECVIDDFEVKERKSESDLIDHKSIVFITAHKKVIRGDYKLI